MKTIAIFDEKNYGLNWMRFKRRSVRGIIIVNNKIALVKSKKAGFYKFPGGGIEDIESHTDTLVREIREETGLIVIPSSMREFGMVHEIRKSIKGIEEIFDQESYYYFVDVEKESLAQDLDDYEIELGYVLEWADIKHAYETNIALSMHYEGKFLLREAAVLQKLL